MLHCFVIDDSEIVRKYTRLIFENLGFRVSEADSPIAAMERLRTEAPDYILLDWRMPGSNSVELLGKIRTLPLGVRPYIIYMVTENDPLEIQRALSHGADNFLLKPFNRQIVEMKLLEIRTAAA
ncbi:response regulator [Hyphomicrobium sp.]|uniref:response regulator n=1 Tax=Hyphomicrobium sp. TaxID=82 RepID=UPI000FAEAE0A|nr:response regulator [Hyphomicrobium sp.]MBN9247848.1 response regulator [Hyphomicrobium sp.]RUP09825.1 MAG: response regulator [Hyphomicrobium sp.]